MRIKVTDKGLQIPRELLPDGMDMVEIRDEGGYLSVKPIDPEDDPIYGLGKNPVTLGLGDAATEHDRYLAEEE